MDTMENTLKLGCNRVGTIHYLPGCFSDKDRPAITIKNAPCIRDEDDGVMW